MGKYKKVFLGILALALIVTGISTFALKGSDIQGYIGTKVCQKKVLYSFKKLDNLNNDVVAFAKFVKDFDKSASGRCLYKVTLFRPEDSANSHENISLTCPKYGNINHADYSFTPKAQGIFGCMRHFAGVAADEPNHSYEMLFSDNGFEGVAVSLDAQGIFSMLYNHRESKGEQMVTEHYKMFEISVEGLLQ